LAETIRVPVVAARNTRNVTAKTRDVSRSDAKVKVKKRKSGRPWFVVFSSFGIVDKGNGCPGFLGF